MSSLVGVSSVMQLLDLDNKQRSHVLHSFSTNKLSNGKIVKIEYMNITDIIETTYQKQHPPQKEEQGTFSFSELPPYWRDRNFRKKNPGTLRTVVAWLPPCSNMHRLHGRLQRPIKIVTLDWKTRIIGGSSSRTDGYVVRITPPHL